MNAQSKMKSVALGLAHIGLNRLTALRKRDRGGLLLEMAISVVVFVLVGTALLRGLGTAHISGANTESQSLSENIARNQMEYIASQPYQQQPVTYNSMVDTTYMGGVALPSGFQVDARGEEMIVGDPEIQKVIVDVYDEGELVMTLETIKANLP